VFPKEGSFSAVLGDNKRRAFHLLVLAILTVSTLVIGPFLTSSLSGQQSWWSRGAWIVAGIIVYFLYLWWQARSQAGRLDAIKERVSQLEPELRKQVRIRSYGARRRLIEAPLRELDLDITPRMGWVRDPRLLEPEPPLRGDCRQHRRRLRVLQETPTYRR
jgi:Ca2+/Na+ antiporter